MKFTKDMSIEAVVRTDPRVRGVLAKFGLGCIGCMAASFETLEQGLKAHGLDVDEVLKALNSLDEQGEEKQA